MNEYVPLFTSPRTVRPVPYVTDVARLALVRASLDPEVSAIEPVPSGCGRAGTPGRVAMVVDAFGEVVPLRIVDDVLAEGLDASGLAYARPMLDANHRALDMVWACRRRYVHASDQVRVLHYLDVCGGECPLIELAQATTSSHDGVTTILALACRGLVSLALDAPLSPETRVKRSRA
ncbi:hypothetical protein [Lichenibacterium dinghuense]|uniref:hypothetical protein n=1 Tax=Lichenibacterium dinghuense TaxID=2895977 RepID=UPI001F3325FB|nr:hypothetical protein [Lichenibacterium sp. 6Y81]